MTDDNDQMWYPQEDPDGQLSQLVAHRDQLIVALRETDDPNLRSDLAFQLRAVTDRIEELTWSLADQPEQHSQPAEPEPTAEQASPGIEVQLGDPDLSADEQAVLDRLDFEDPGPDGLGFGDNGLDDHDVDGPQVEGHDLQGHELQEHDLQGHDAPGYGDPRAETDGLLDLEWTGDEQHPHARTTSEQPAGSVAPPEPAPADLWPADPTAAEQPWGQGWDGSPAGREWQDGSPTETRQMEQPPADPDWSEEPPLGQPWPNPAPVDAVSDQPGAGGRAWPEQHRPDQSWHEPAPGHEPDDASHRSPDADHQPLHERTMQHRDVDSRGIDESSGPAPQADVPGDERHIDRSDQDRTGHDHWYEPAPDQQAIVDRPYAWPDPVQEPPQQPFTSNGPSIGGQPPASMADRPLDASADPPQDPQFGSPQDPQFGSVGSGYRPSMISRPIPGSSVPRPYRPPIEGRPRRAAANGPRPDRGRADRATAPLNEPQDGSPVRDGFVRPSGPVLAVVGISLALLAGVLWFGDAGRSTSTANEAVAPAGPEVASESGPDAEVVAGVNTAIQDLGLPGVVADVRDGVIHVAGPVPTQADYDAVAAAVGAAAATYPVDLSALVVMGDEAGTAEDAAPVSTADRPEALQNELDRILAATPLIFNPGEAALTELHQRILNNAVISLQAYPGFNLTVAGYTDDTGDDAQNRQLSLSRAENVRAYLVAQGLPEGAFQVEARGEDTSSGSAGLAGLERRVEFEVTGAGALPAGNQDAIRVAIVAPSASNDLAFTQSMVDAVNLIASERPIELAVTDNTFVPEEAAAAVRGYAEQGFNLVIAHGSQFGAALLDIAPQFPATTFAWGTASDTFGLPNVYAYDAAAQEGGYVLGALASGLSNSKVVGVVGPIEVGDAAQYVNGFDAGAKAENPSTNVLVSYIGSFSDIGLASEAAKAHQSGGADVMTGSAQMVVGAIAAAEQQGTLWFGTQANQAPLAPSIVVASQVYHWEVAIRPIIADIEAGTIAGKSYTANLANGGLVIEYNPEYPLAPEARQRADELSAAIANGSITPPQ